MLLKTLSIAAALALVTASAPASAFEHGANSALHETVDYSDLNIGGAPGATAL